MGERLLCAVAIGLFGCYQGVPPFDAPGLATDGDGGPVVVQDETKPEDMTTGDEFDPDDGSSSEGGSPELSDVGSPPAETRLTSAVDITTVEISQGVATVVGRDGAGVLPDPSTDPAVVMNRNTIFRASYVNTGNVGRVAEAHLLLSAGGEETVITEDVALQSTGVVEWLASASLIRPGLEYAVEFRTNADVPPQGATGTPRVPALGESSIGVRSDAAALSVYILPVHHQVAGCSQAPTPDPSWYDALEDHLWMQYPVADLDFEVAEPWVYTGAMTDFTAVLNDLSAHRVALGLGQDVYTYGLLLPCDDGEPGVGGRGWRSDADAMGGYYRTSLGRFYPDNLEFSVTTVIHEIGHNHGRQHVGCEGEGDPDPAYPTAGGLIGREGWGMIDDVVRDAGHADFMTYCSPTWVSPYGWNRAFERGVLVAAMGSAPAGEVVVAMDGGEASLRWQTVFAPLVPQANRDADLELWNADGLVAIVPARATAEGETGRRSFAARVPPGVTFTDVRVARR